MLTKDQIQQFSRQMKTNESVVVREYIQVLFLKELYMEKYAENIFFKGGTAIRLILNGTRFSEDLDFTVMGGKASFNAFVKGFFKKINKLYNFSFKDRHSLIGVRYLLTYDSKGLGSKVFINLDFSFREKVLETSKSIVETEYPVVFRSFVNHLSAREIVE